MTSQTSAIGQTVGPPSAARPEERSSLGNRLATASVSAGAEVLSLIFICFDGLLAVKFDTTMIIR